jgi:hypothetical protein
VANEAKIQITAEDKFSRVFAALRNDVTLAKDHFGSLSSAASMANNVIGKIAFGSSVGAAGAVAGFLSLSHALAELNDSAETTGSTVEKLSALEDVARRNGGSLDLVTTSLVKLNKALISATPNSPAAEALKALGLSAAELRQDDPADALVKIARAMDGFADDGNKARIVQELFGKSLKEVAPFLHDLVQAGSLNAQVTAQQAEEAKKFNRELYALQTNIYEAGRALASSLIPGLNNLFERFRAMRDVFGGIGSALLANAGFDDASDAVERYSKKLKDLQEQQRRFQSTPGNALGMLGADLQGEIDRVRKLIDFYTRAGVAAKEFAGAGRGFVNPEANLPGKPRLPDVTNQIRAQATEAERYLASLQKQVDATQHLSAEEQVLLDIRRKTVDLNPAQQANALRLAEEIDLEKQLGLEKKRNEADLDFLISARLKRLDAIDNAAVARLIAQEHMISDTPTMRRQSITFEVDELLQLSRRNPDDKKVQQAILERMAELRKRMEDLPQPLAGAGTAADKFADAIEVAMHRSTDAVLDFVVEGRGSLGTLFQAFRRDVLRELIEDPIRDSMRSAVSAIRKELGELGSGANPFQGILRWMQDIFGGGGGGFFGLLAGLFGGGGGGTGGGGGAMASGGNVRAGQLIRWQENGKEWFVPGSDGTVLNPAQQRALGSSGVNITQVFNVNGDVSSQTINAMRAMIAQNNAQLARSIRTGGARAMA